MLSGKMDEAVMAGYDHGDLAEEAKRQGISKSTAERWNLIWIEKGMVTKENHGIYRKVAWDFETLELWRNFINTLYTAYYKRKYQSSKVS